MPALRQNVMISLWRIRQRLAKLDLLVENGLGKNTLKICSFYQKHSKIEKSSSCVKQKGRLGKIGGVLSVFFPFCLEDFYKDIVVFAKQVI